MGVQCFLRSGAFRVVLLFMIANFSCWCEGCSLEERNALLDIKYSFHYPNGVSHSDWVGEDCCNWGGVFCNNSRVSELSLSYVRERDTGTWYPNATLFAQLEELASLDLSGNYIGGWTIPQGLCNLTNLQALYLWDNRLEVASIPSCLGNLSKLKLLDLGSNKLKVGFLGVLAQMKSLTLLNLGYNKLNESSSPLSGLCNLTNLQQLYLWGNDLEDASVPSCLGNLSELKELDLSNNKLKGGFSRGLCGMTNLRQLNLGANHLEDTSIPSCLGNPSKLKELDLNNNLLKGGFLRVIAKMKSLTDLDLRYNDLNESSSPLSGLCDLTNLQHLDLGENYVEDAKLPSCLGNLSKLKELYLDRNNLKGGFSRGLCNMTNLQKLDLSYNNLEDAKLPTCLGDLSKLEELDLHNNNLKGGFIKAIAQMKNLTNLDLSYNELNESSSLFSGFCELRNLVSLNLSSNAIQGRIHPCLGNLTSVEKIYLEHNHLDGVVIFSMFANLSHLTRISFRNNPQLEVETEDTTWIPKFQLAAVDFSYCKLNNRSGGGIPRFLATQNNLECVLMSHSSLTGYIPSWLFYNQSGVRYLDVSGNSLQVNFPQFFQHNTSNIEFLDLSDNLLHGLLPTHIGMFFPQLKVLNMSSNAFKGKIPSDFGKGLNLQVLDLSNNNLSGDIPHGLVASNETLVYLSLSNNRLGGDILSRFTKMTRLERLFLDRNEFTGMISHLTAFPILTSLLLGRNKLVGKIPTELCQMQNLHMLDLSDNKLSGTIPSCLINITSWKNEISITTDIKSVYGVYWFLKTHIDFTTKREKYSYNGMPLSLMTGIDFSVNQLMGNIPSEMGYLKAVRSLNLSNNYLTGPLPESFQYLKDVESLDLSHNMLTGSIPQQLTQLTSLEIFNVSFNNFSGRLPDFKNQFATFDESSYMNNVGLCGKPLDRNCSRNNHSNHQDEEKEEDGSRLIDNPVFFYSCVAISYVLGFWGFLVLLIFNKNWRRKYYTAMDRYMGLFNETISRFLICLRNYRRKT